VTKLYAHPFSSYCQKVLIPLYENATPFEYRVIGPENPQVVAEFAALSPVGRFPLLVDGERAVFESTIIVEYLDLHHPGPVRMIPEDQRAALEVRTMDRFFDNYVMTPVQKIVLDSMREPDQRDAAGVADARTLLRRAYGWLERTMSTRQWAAGDHFSLADCAAAPSLFYADWVEPIGDERPHARDYRARLLARPSFARAVDEARPYRKLFPPGAPDRD
jgi:glutathione S-transferase